MNCIAYGTFNNHATSSGGIAEKCFNQLLHLKWPCIEKQTLMPCVFPIPIVRQLHREFLRAGANVMQTFTFYASDDKLENRGNKLSFTVR